MIRARVIVASNRAAAGVYEDTSGPLLVAGLRELGCEVDAPVVVPDGADARRVIDVAFRRYDLSLGGGLARLAGRVFRIGHLGDVNELMLLGALAGAEMALLDADVPVEPGSGVAAAQRYWRQHPAGLPDDVRERELVASFR